MPIVNIPVGRITNRDTVHAVFAEALGFPPFYGRNMDAWIDCLTYVDEPDAGMTKVTVGAGDVLALQLDEVNEFAGRCPDLYDTLIECAAFVNWRRIEIGERPILALSFYKGPSR
jgi:hypothetical protein